MAETITSMHACPVNFTTTLTCTVVDEVSPGGRSVVFNNSGTSLWYRTYLVSAASSGTLALPTELLRHVADRLNATTSLTRWSVALQSDGYVGIRYTHPVGYAASITWGATATSGLYVARALGFTSNVSSNNTTQVGDYHPTHVMYLTGRADDGDWTPEPAGLAVAETAGGVVDALSDGYARVRRSFRIFNAPRTWSDRTAYAMAGTPAWPEELTATGAWTNPGGSAGAGTAPPWSIHQHLAASLGRVCAFTLGDFQQHITAATTRYDTGYFGAGTYKTGQQFQPITPLLRARVYRNGVDLLLAGRETRF